MTLHAAPPTELLAASRCVLLVIDKQAGYFDVDRSIFLERSDRAKVSAVLGAIDGVIGAARKAGVPVLWTRMTEDPATAPPNLARVMGQEPACPKGSLAWAFLGTRPSTAEPVLDKMLPDAFTNPDLASALAGAARSSLVLVGGLAGRCVLATAFSAAASGFDVVVPSDCLLGHDDSEHEEEVVAHIIRTTIGWVIRAGDLLQQWASA